MKRKTARLLSLIPALGYLTLPLFVEMPIAPLEPFNILIATGVWGLTYTILAVFFAEYKPR